MEPQVIQPQQNQPSDNPTDQPEPVQGVNEVPVTPSVETPSYDSQPAEESVAPVEPTVVEPQASEPEPTVDTPGLVTPSPSPWQSPSTEASTAAPTVSGTKSRKGLKTAGLVAALLVVFVVGYVANSGVTGLSHKKAGDSVKAFVGALNKGDNASAYKLTSANFRAQQSESDFAKAMGDLKASKPSFSYEYLGFNGRTASFTGVEEGLPATSDGSTTGTFTIAMVQSGPVGWKVDSVTVN